MAEKKISVSLEGRMDSLSRTLQQAETATERHTSAMANSFRRVDSGIMSVGSALGVLASGAIVAGLGSATRAATQMDAAVMGLSVTARYAGVSITAANEAAKGLTSDGLMSLAEASKGLQNLLSRGFSLDEAVKLMNGFKDSAAFGRQASLQFGEAVVTATEGLRNENSILVDNAGVTKNVSVMWKEYAAEHGTTAEKLTQSQKRQAELNGILRETEGQTGNAALMAETFAGAQARANQQATELKTTLGAAVQPALQAVLTILTPVVRGLRDMVYWVETLGVSAGGVYDKLKIRMEETFSLPKAGEAAGFRERNKRIAERQAEVDRNVDAARADIVYRSEGATLPNIGKDSGARRQDVVLPPSAAEKRAEAARKESEEKKKAAEHQRQLNEAMQVGLPAVELYYKELQERAAIQREMDLDAIEALGQTEERLNYYGRMSDRQQAAFDQTSMEKGWAARNAESDDAAARAGAQFSAQRADMNGDNGYQARLQMIQMEEEAWIRSWAMQTDSFEVYEQRKTEIEALMGEKRIALLRSEEQRKLDGTMMYTNTAAGLFGSLYEISGKKLKVFFYMQQTANAASAVMSGYKAGAAALEPPPIGLGPVAGAALSSMMIAGGYLSAAAIMAQTVMGPKGGGAGSASYGAGTPTSPVVTQPNYNQTPQMGNMTFIIQGNVMEDKYVEERLIPLLNSAGTRNVRIEYLSN